MHQSALILAFAGLATLSSAAPITKRQPSGKRGLAFAKNLQGKSSMFTGAGHVSWAYDWEGRACDQGPGYAVPGVEYVPMLHSNDPMFTNVFAADVAAAVAKGAGHILSINEPDQCGGGGTCLDVGTAIATHKQFVQSLANKYPNVKISAPAVTNGQAPMGVDYLKRFLAGCDGCKIDYVAAHWYGPADVEAFKNHIISVHNGSGGKPVWVTEYAATSGDIQGFLTKTMAWMDSQDFVQRYAYYSVEAGLTAGNSLTALGNAYATS